MSLNKSRSYGSLIAAYKARAAGLTANLARFSNRQNEISQFTALVPQADAQETALQAIAAQYHAAVKAHEATMKLLKQLDQHIVPAIYADLGKANPVLVQYGLKPNKKVVHHRASKKAPAGGNDPKKTA